MRKLLVFRLACQCVNRSWSTLMLFLLTFVSAWAGPVDKQVAKEKALQFLKQHHSEVTLESDEPAYAPKRQMGGAESAEETPAFYVFNAEGDAGYVIISGDDRTEDVLGYATEGNFDTATMPANVAAWLEGYADQMAQLATYSQQPSTTDARSKQWVPIAPMITTRWNQLEPYNQQCPMHDGERSVTGCTATALAQIMNYHEWPATATTAIPAYTTNPTEIYCPELPSIVFAWDEMEDAYGYEDDAPAVAELMRYCGQAIQAGYSNSGTGATLSMSAYALKTYFDYDPRVKRRHLRGYTVDDWEEIIYSELQAGRPVLHAGYSMTAGHAFLCDGYDGNGLYHFNWGWGGAYDGYFKLALLNPETGQVGSGSSDGYAYGQEIVIGIQPATGEPVPTELFDPHSEQFIDDILYSFFYNPNPDVETAYVGFGLLDENLELKSVLKDCGTMTLKGNNEEYAYIGLYLGRYAELDLAPGTYRIATICKLDKSGAWQRVGPTLRYFEVEIGEKNAVKRILLHPVTELEVTDMTCPEKIVAQVPMEVTATVTNKADDANTGLYLFATSASGEVEEYTRVNLLMRSGESTTCYFQLTLNNAGAHTLWLSESKGDTVNYHFKKKVNVQRAPSRPANLQLVNTAIDPEGLSVTVTIQNKGLETYYRGMVFYLYEYVPKDQSYHFRKQVTVPGEILCFEQKDFTALFEDAISSWSYAVYIGYYKNHADVSPTQLGDYLFLETGLVPVETVTLSPQTDGVIYDLNGRPMQSPARNGIYIVDGKKCYLKK